MNSGFKIQDTGYKIPVSCIMHHVSCIFFITCCFLLGICFLIPGSVHAHRVNIYAYAEGGTVHSESYFVDGTKCKNSVVEVFDEKNGTKLLEGKTDENGNFSFKIPKATPLKLVLHASMGHQSEYTLTEDEVREAMGQEVEKTEKKGKKQTTQTPMVKKTEQTSSMKHFDSSDLSEIEAIVERVTDRKLQPIMRTLVTLKENTEKPGITEILGGIGYIIGIMGIIFYFKRRR